MVIVCIISLIRTKMIGGIDERLYHGYSYFTVTSTCLINSMLIYVIIVTHINDFGPYRWLFITFAVINICIALIHPLLIPTVSMAEFDYICIANRFVAQSTVYGYGFGTIVVVVDAGWRPSEISRKAYAPVIREVYGIDLYADNLPWFLALTLWVRNDSEVKEWQIQPLIAMTALFSLVLASAAVIVFCLVRIVREMSGAKCKKSPPPVENSTDAATALSCSDLAEVSMGGLGTLFLMCTQLFLMIDPFLILFFISRNSSIRTMGLLPFTISTVKSTSNLQNAKSGQNATPVVALTDVPRVV
ncbi:hypothetical protein PRIPAC_78386 [Pristionchus pacificus]|uniref:G protein-coupled receptor n=1 Tax=Pristionchus pacificus TaxID=54126 RepID=A0A2A6C2T0_PRIPA|nr:hypothetical protein PRIPAC_78386 [Pristionchus pacificus]|eukprot:PDM72343.1 G protein-coupled receptor [Pristionchus pacificus]